MGILLVFTCTFSPLHGLNIFSSDKTNLQQVSQGFVFIFFSPLFPSAGPSSFSLPVRRRSSFARELHIFIYSAAAYFLTLRFIWSSTGGGGNGDRPRFISDDNNLRTNFGGRVERRAPRPCTANEWRVKRLKSSVGLPIVSKKSRNQYAWGVLMNGPTHHRSTDLQPRFPPQTYGS